MKLIDRTGKEHIVNPMKVKDILDVIEDVNKACYSLNINTGKQIECTTEEGQEAVAKLLPYFCADISNFDLVMTKQALVWYLGLNKQYEYVEPCRNDISFKEKITMQNNLCNLMEQKQAEMKVMKPEQAKETQLLLKMLIRSAKNDGILEDDEHMIDKLEVGTTVTGRNGKTYKAYSHLITEYKEAIELLSKVDAVNVSENVQEEDPEAYEALLEIIFRAFNREVSKRVYLRKDGNK
ncbi:hypothetical protein P22_3540 [Propionispora sp. 2/2-37]|uniref:hypothetical protein n=1 Tax=Propionispora sp. 2/2-37 TaxID=1677858 RepID=UPI0006BB6C08|nr:hypothetical protein [Propionispora sp. 2/2-37]CUH97411.1 hypothetical protein P22_3540 [Propionispora sp. 2/2-37]